MSKFNPDYYEECGNLWLVYQWSPKWKRYVNTHAFPKDMEDAEGHAKRSCRGNTPKKVNKQ